MLAIAIRGRRDIKHRLSENVPSVPRFDGLETNCAIVANLASGGVLDGVSGPFQGGVGGPLLLYLSGGSVTTINHNDWGGMMEYSSSTSSFDGEWVTLNQFVGMVQSYYNGLGYLNDEQRLRSVARGVVAGAGGIADWRFIAGFYLASGGSAALDAVVSDLGLVEGGQMFGTRFNGNFPAFNSADEIRIGYWFFSETGEYGFRITGDWLGGDHIFLWPPKWWLGGPL